MTSRISPATAPFTPKIQAALDTLMPAGIPPLTLFTVLANDTRLFDRFMGGGLLDKGHLSLRQREILIHRVTAQNGSEYEWGVHAAFFADKVSLTEDQLYSIVHGTSADECWAEEAEALLLDTCDTLHAHSTLSQSSWDALSVHYTDMAILEILMVCGAYRTVSYLTNAINIPQEGFGRQFPNPR